jgi:hypothetical protein
MTFFIFKLHHNSGWVSSHGDKQLVAQTHFKSDIGRGEPSTLDFNWNSLNLPACDLEGKYYELERVLPLE